MLGWQVRRSTPDVALLAASSRRGLELEGEVLVKHQQHTLLIAIFVQLDNPIARAVWAAVAPGHPTGRATPPRAGQPQDS
jgi:hypothetical protein